MHQVIPSLVSASCKAENQAVTAISSLPGTQGEIIHVFIWNLFVIYCCVGGIMARYFFGDTKPLEFLMGEIQCVLVSHWFSNCKGEVNT